MAAPGCITRLPKLRNSHLDTLKCPQTTASITQLNKPCCFCVPGTYYITLYILVYISGLSLQLVQHLLFHPGPHHPKYWHGRRGHQGHNPKCWWGRGYHTKFTGGTYSIPSRCHHPKCQWGEYHTQFTAGTTSIHTGLTIPNANGKREKGVLHSIYFWYIFYSICAMPYLEAIGLIPNCITNQPNTSK